MSAYSFKDVTASIDGPGGSFEFGSGAGVSAEGITIAPGGEKNIMTVGADGSVMHSLRADKSATVTVVLLKTSPTNAKLQNMFNYQFQSSQYWGQNTITVRNAVRGDLDTCSQCAFATQPEKPYKEEGGTVTWTFHAGDWDAKEGTGTPELE